MSVPSCDAIAATLADDGVAIVPNFLADAHWRALRGIAAERHRCREFHAAGVGRGAALQQREEIRNDEVAWLDTGDDASAVRQWFERIDELRLAVNRALFLGVFDFETHFAVYAPGHFYRRHLDVFQGTSTRAVTVIVYLNDEWQSEQGGALRLYLDDTRHRDILPTGGTLVTFLSERFHHEVLPATRERLSVTGWLRRR